MLRQLKVSTRHNLACIVIPHHFPASTHMYLTGESTWKQRHEPLFSELSPCFQTLDTINHGIKARTHGHWNNIFFSPSRVFWPKKPLALRPHGFLAHMTPPPLLGKNHFPNGRGLLLQSSLYIHEYYMTRYLVYNCSIQ